MGDFETKDSGQREQWSSGMQRDSEEGKARFDLMIPEGVPYDEQILTRFAELLARGAIKYDARNWEKATGEEEIARAKSSAFRHFMQWFCGETDEDHAVAVMFNLMVVETVRAKQRAEQEEEDSIAFAVLADALFGGPRSADLDDESPTCPAESGVLPALDDLRPIMDKINEDIQRLAAFTMTEEEYLARFIVDTDGVCSDEEDEAPATEAGQPRLWEDEAAYEAGYLRDSSIVDSFGPDLLRKHPTRWDQG